MTRHLSAYPITLSLLACTADVDPTIRDVTSATEPPPSTSHEPTSSTASDSTSASDATSGSTGPLEPLNCGMYTIESWGAVPRVMLVLDKSGSMVAEDSGYWDADADDADDDGFTDADPATPATPKITRWQSLHETVAFILAAHEPRLDFGAVLFPSLAATSEYDASACLVNADPDVPVAPDQAAQILATIPPADSLTLAGATPTTAGIRAALAGLVSDGEHPRAIVLVTDGAANCPQEPADATPASLFEDYDEQLPQIVADALAAEIPTFVVGIDIADITSDAAQDGLPDDTNPYQRLNAVALAGGTPREGAEKFYNAHNQLELQSALTEISDRITPCTFDLGYSLPSFIWLDVLTIDKDGPNPLKYDRHQVTDCATESGWHFTDATKSAIELCGDACTLYKQTGDLEVIFQCYD